MTPDHLIEAAARKIAKGKGHHPDQMVSVLPPVFETLDIKFIYHTEHPRPLWTLYYDAAKACLEAMTEEGVVAAE